MDRKLVSRLFLFFFVLPALIGLAFWDVWHHFPLNLLLAISSVIGTMETAALLKTKNMDPNPYLIIGFGLTFPVLGYLEIAGIIHSEQTLAIAIVVVLVVFVRQIFVNTEVGLQPVLNKVAGNLLTLIYPGFFMYFLVRLTGVENSSILLTIFAMATFGNDSNAWLFGNLFGKKSPKPFLVSPKKSIIGFIGGILGTFIVLICSYFWFPGLLGTNLWMLLLFAAILALTVIIGDLFESSLKRSAGVKDSGTIIPGRGGILDSIDSLLFAAPIFYIFLTYGRF